MSDSLGESLIRNLITMGLDDAFAPFQSTSISSERLSDDSWMRDAWIEGPFKPDRSMSLTDSRSPNDVPPPPGFPPLTALPSNRYKTELCRSFQEHGTCKYGSKCQFAHGEAELRGLYRHPKYKTQACRTFYQFGYCPYGSRCHFIHGEKSPTPEENPRLLRQSVSFAGFPGSRSASPPFNGSPSFTRDELLSDRLRFERYCSAGIGSAETRCACGHGSPSKEQRNKTFVSLQRFPSEDSLSDRDSYSSTGSSSGSESPSFDGSGGKRLSVFARMSVSD